MSSQLAERCIINIQLVTSHHGLATLSVPYNRILFILLAFNFKELHIICKPRHMKCFQTIFSNTFFLPRLMFLSSQVGEFDVHMQKNILLYVVFFSPPFRSEVKWFLNYYVLSYMSQCLLVRDVVQLLPTLFLHPYSVMFHQSRLMKGSMPQNEKHRMCIPSRDLNYARNNLCNFIKNDVDFCRNSTDVFCFRNNMAICKPRYQNLGIRIGIGNGIGIGTDITNAIISSSIRSMNPKLSRVVTQDERTPPTPLTKSRDTSMSWSRDK